MPMEQMNMPWYMGGIEWLELSLFWIATLIVLTVLIVSFAKRPTSQIRKLVPFTYWRKWPEVRLITLALPLELLWELAQFPLYDVWHQNDWGYILYGLAHCTIGDLLILLFFYEIIALFTKNRSWYAMNNVISRTFLFTLLGSSYTVYSEIMNVRVKATWGYTELMPIIPIVDIGGMPFLQWVLIPPVILWLMRMVNSEQNINK